MSKTIYKIKKTKDQHINILDAIYFLGLLALFIIPTKNYGQESVDISTPQLSNFNSGQNIEGFIQNSINEATGKVAFGVPIASISARGVAYNVSLTYDGKSSFDIGRYTNKYNPTSIVGVGFSLPISKIMVDNKGTATKEDDDFYLQDGNSTKLLGTKKNNVGNTEGKIVWEFQTEKYVPWKIKYYKAEKFYLNGVLTERPLDYWIVIDDKGTEYIYGETQNSRENMVAWGNWIGNSKKNGGSKETIVWSLSTIKDQWNNNIKFEYELQENFVGNIKQTEASYIKKITSSTGEKIRFNYSEKSESEFYEPHKEAPEPDAFQERYEKKYLQNIITYNGAGGLMYTYNFTYTLANNSSSQDKKRYLFSITQENKNGESLPNQKFEFHTTGKFKGGIKKIIYPMGSSVTYNYEDKALFNNTPNSTPNYPDYNYYSILTKDNYTLMLLKSKKPITDGKHRFMVVRNSWNGQSWNRHTFILPYLIRDTFPVTGVWLENLQSVFEEEYYGFLHQEGTQVRLNLFHLQPDGKNWYHETTSLDIRAGKPTFISSDEFVAIGEHHRGKIHLYRWNNKGWEKRIINQGVGQYYYAATNNFILSLDRDGGEDGGQDMITGKIHEDNYYIHYLDINKKWQTKSWSEAIDHHLYGVNGEGYFYPNNVMSGFAYNDHKFLLRWDENYNVLEPDTFKETGINTNPIIATYSGMFTHQNWFYQHALSYARFNGVNWNFFKLPPSSSYYAKPSYGEDFATFQNHDNKKRTGYVLYDPNIDTWQYTNGLNSYDPYSSNNKLTAMAGDFLIAGNQIYNFSNTSLFPIANQTLPYSNVFSHTDGANHGFVELSSITTSGSSASGTFQKGMYIYVNKENNSITTTDVGKRYHMAGPTSFAGRTPFISSKSLWLKSESFRDYLYRIIDNKINNYVRDIVVDKIEINNGNGEIRETLYSYDFPNSTINNDATFYGNVTVENKGYGTSSIGTIVKKYNNGEKDIQMAGLLLEEFVKNTEGITKSYSKNTYSKYNILDGYTIKQTKQENTMFFDGAKITNSIETSFINEFYLPVRTKRTNSKGQIEETYTKYGFSQYSEMKNKNFLSQPYQVITLVDGKTVSVQRTKWVDKNGKIHASETWAGDSLTELRKISEVTKINDFGQAIETSNGWGQYESLLYGYGYKYPIATISNSRYDDVINSLDVTETALQNLNNPNLKSELLKLYDRLPNTMVKASLYDAEGNLTNQINERQREIKRTYDNFNRLDFISDHNDNVLKKNIYNYGSN